MLKLPKDIEETLKKVEISLREYFLKSEKQELQTLEAIGMLKREFSIVVFLSAKASREVHRFVMKKVIEHPLNRSIHLGQNQSVVEYEILRYLHPLFKSIDGCSVPRPILVVPEVETFVMEFVDGRFLSDELKYARYWASNAEFQKLKEYFYLAGRWLQNFQNFTSMEQTGAEVFNSMIERCDHILKLIEEKDDPRCPKDLRNRVLHQLEEQFLVIHDKEILVCGRHGDFGTWNIIVRPEGIAIIDFMGYCKEPVAVDILKMLAGLEEDKLSIFLSKHRIDILKESFLRGLGKIPPILDPVLRICEIHQRVCNLCGRVLSYPTGFRQRIERHFAIKNNITWLINTHERKLLWPLNKPTIG